MRHDQCRRLIDHGIPEQNQIEIDRARRAGIRPLASELLLEREQQRQELARGERGLSNRGRVEELGLGIDANGIGVVEG
jgi:hypothetical protein